MRAAELGALLLRLKPFSNFNEGSLDWTVNHMLFDCLVCIQLCYPHLISLFLHYKNMSMKFTEIFKGKNRRHSPPAEFLPSIFLNKNYKMALYGVFIIIIISDIQIIIIIISDIQISLTSPE